jgi:hypothetical protein
MRYIFCPLKGTLLSLTASLPARHFCLIPFLRPRYWPRRLPPHSSTLVDPSLLTRSRVSSGRIVSDYGLDDRAIGVRSPAGTKDLSSILCDQTGSGVHPASCTMGTGGPLPGGKARPGRDADHSPPSSAEVVNE